MHYNPLVPRLIGLILCTDINRDASNNLIFLIVLNAVSVMRSVDKERRWLTAAIKYKINN